VAGHLSKGFCAAAFLSIIVVVLVAACSHPRSTSDDTTATSNEISQTLVGKQIIIHGKFSLRGKVGPYIVLDNQQVVYLVPGSSFTWGKPYSEMEGKLVAASGVLRFYHAPPPESTARPEPRLRDFFYFDAENARLQLSH
jgi:hypothetical protein